MQAQFTITPVRPESPRAQSAQGVLPRTAYALAGMAIAAIWISVVLASAWAPDFISGSQHEHLPLVGLTTWLWGAVATGIVVLATLEGLRTHYDRAAWLAIGIGVSLVWLGVLVVALFAPVFVTGTDPTSIPLAAMGAPIVGVFLTWFVCLFAKAGQAAREPDRMIVAAPNATATLRELAGLRDAGVITAEDFEAKKTELLSRI